MSTPAQAVTLPIRSIQLHLLEAAPWNVTEPSKRSLNLLTQNIKEVGFAETVLVVPIADGRFRIISGHDKTRAALAAGLTEIPCSVLPEHITEEMQKLQTVRMNVIKKKMNPAKLLNIHDELRKAYGEEVAKAMLMYTDQQALEHHIATARKALPKDVHARFDKKAEGISTIEDLGNVVEEMYARTGSSNLDKGFLIFSSQNQQHIYVAMDKELDGVVHQLVERATAENKHITEVFKDALGVKK